MVLYRGQYAERINPSLVYAGVERIIYGNGGGHLTVSIPGYSEPWVDGQQPIPLLWEKFAAMRGVTDANLEVSLDGQTSSYSLQLLPLNAWDMRIGERFARATAAMVLDESPTVDKFVGSAACTPADFAATASAKVRAERVYTAFKRAFRLYYSYKLSSYGENEQAVRFPAQIVNDGGSSATCIDLALFLAAAMFRAGCQPVIAIFEISRVERHAVVGVWADGRPRQAIYLDGGTLARAMRNGLLIALDPNQTTIADSDFANACAVGRRQAAEMTPCYGSDVGAARNAHISGLRLLRKNSSDEIVADDMPIIYADEATTLTARKAEEALSRYALKIVASVQKHLENNWRPLRFTVSSHRATATGEHRDPRFRIGRGGGNDFVINDILVSHHHCAILASDEGFFLQDLNSANGTFMEGKRLTISKPEPLRPGDQFWLGESKTVVFMLVLSDEANS